MKYIATVVAACLTLLACQDVNPAAPVQSNSISVASVAVTLAVAPSSDTLALGDSTALKATLRDASGAVVSGQVQWSLTDSSVASITASGVIRGRSAGLAQAVATSGALADSARLIVMAPSALTPALPRVRVAIGMPAITRVLSVSAGGDLQAAVDSARGGDAIELPAGASFY
jgi:hypothetical protein